MGPANTLRILLVDDHPFMRSALRTVFERNKAFAVIAVAENFPAAVLAASMTTPDIVLTDIHMQPINGIELTKYFVRRYPGITVIGFSNTFFQSDIQAMKDAGAAGVIQKGIALEDLYHTILSLAHAMARSHKRK
jgi:DNA-binding NarL/FixJ family response regulator